MQALCAKQSGQHFVSLEERLRAVESHDEYAGELETWGLVYSSCCPIFLVYVGPRVGAHICLNLGVGLDRILHHTAKYLRVVARLPLAIYISAWGAFLTCNTACSYAPAHAFASVVFELCSYLFHC